MDAPETPAHLFAVRAFKQALFGTPPPVARFVPKMNGATFQSIPQIDVKSDEAHATARIRRKPETTTQQTLNSSPTKPTGILMTPGTAAGRRKQVKFGEKVVDNEGKRNKYSTSGLPDDCPGKFPSPWTPKVMPASSSQDTGKTVTASSSSIGNDTRLESKFKEALKQSTHQKPQPVSISSRVKDDSDITADIQLPSSASGRYWKEQYETYATRSEAELNRLIAKHRIAKDYAKMKDEEVTALRAQSELDRSKRQDRETSLEKQIKDLRERLRGAMAENARMSTELSLLRSSQGLTGTASNKPEMPTHDSTRIRSELLNAGFRDVKIPVTELASQGKGSGRGIGSSHAATETAIPESSGQDIWLDHDDEEDTLHFRRRKAKSAPSVSTPHSNRMALQGFDAESAPLSSKAIREKLSNPLAARSDNIPGKLPLSQTSSKLAQDDIFNFLSNSQPSQASLRDSTTPNGRPKGRSPRSTDANSSSLKIGDKRKDSALARIEQRRKNRRESRLSNRQSVA
jgi:Cut12 conserved domain